MTAQYTHTFNSINDNAQEFTLTFKVHPGRKAHHVTSVECYQRRTDTFCNVLVHASAVRTVLTINTILGPEFRFNIEIYLNPQGCEIIILEIALTTIALLQLHPTNIQDNA